MLDHLVAQNLEGVKVFSWKYTMTHTDIDHYYILKWTIILRGLYGGSLANSRKFKGQLQWKSHLCFITKIYYYEHTCTRKPF